MKNKGFIFTAICLIMANFKVFGYEQLETGPSSYVVIGAFAIEKNAIRFVKEAKKLNFKPESSININRGLFYVYVMQTEDKKMAMEEANKIRQFSPFYDTWVYTGFLGSNAGASGTDINPVTSQPIANVEIQDTTWVVPSLEKNKSEEIQEKKSSLVEPEEGSKNFLFRILRAQDQKEIPGDVDLIDGEKSRKVASLKGNQNVVLKRLNKSGRISVICEVFGYHKLQRDLNFDKPLETEGVVEENGQTIVPFELTGLRKGDVAVMYRVYFYKDAAIMRPESRYEVYSLLQMMKENPGYRILIHGHTNGGSHGKIVTMGASNNFFSLNDTKSGFGSAKKLSAERAGLIRSFLIAEGIDVKRLETKAWGGKRPIQDKLSPRAQDNVRVEVEILDDK